MAVKNTVVKVSGRGTNVDFTIDDCSVDSLCSGVGKEELSKDSVSEQASPAISGRIRRYFIY